MTIAAFPRRVKGNPYLNLLYGHLEKLGVSVVPDAELSVGWLRRHRRSVDVLHFHWLFPLYRHWRGGIFTVLSAGMFVLKVLVARLLGYTVVWTMHNYQPHDSGDRLADSLVRMGMTRAAKVIVHCEYARTLLGRNRAYVIPHGNYVSHYPNTITREEARRRLGVAQDAHLFLNFGLIRPYKGFERMVGAFKQLNNGSAYLLIVGEAAEKAGKEIVEKLNAESRNPRLIVVPRFITDDEVQIYLNACDIVVCPFEKILTSGSVILAFSFGKGVIVPDIGCLSELRDSGAAIVYDSNDPSGLLSAMRQSMEADIDKLGETARELVCELRWDRIASMHLDAYLN